MATGSPYPWQLRVGGPDGTVHTRPAGTAEADLPYPAWTEQPGRGPAGAPSSARFAAAAPHEQPAGIRIR
ncbi:hypothetical protein [Streptomyces sp. NBC_00443]|uniref:hypothetical protein n=1 Tax=Streptomyces sp. NBC_00443 TaxID=2975743 RepID=UPI002E1EABA8